MEPIVHELIQRIYLAGADRARWPEFLQALCDQIDAASAIVTFVDLQNPAGSVQASVGFPPGALELWAREYAHDDPFLVRSIARGLHKAGHIGLVDELISDEELITTRMYREYGEKYGYIGGIAGVVYADARFSALFGANRRPGRHFGPREVALFTDLMPHMATSLQIHHDLLARTMLGRAALATLNRLSTAVFVCAQDGRVLHHNAAAAAALVDRVGISIEAGRLTGTTRLDTAALRSALVRAASGGPFGDAEEEPPLILSRSGGQRAVVAVVTPIEQDSLGELVQPMVAVLLNDPDRLPRGVAGVLRQIYSLTSAEAGVAVALLHGESVNEISSRLDLSRETTRTHVKRLFAKTETNRQQDLLRVLLTSLGPPLAEK